MDTDRDILGITFDVIVEGEQHVRPAPESLRRGSA
jgi:hypothetical protein